MRTLEELLAPDADLTNLTAEEEALLFGNEPTPTPAEPEAPAEPTPEATPAPAEPEPTPVDEELVKKKLKDVDDIEEAKRIAFERSNKINQLQQQNEALQRKLQDASKKVESMDVWDGDVQRSTLKTVEELRVQNEELQKRLAAIESEKQLVQIYEQVETNLEKLAGKPSTSIATLDRTYNEVSASLGRAATAKEMVERGIDHDDARKYVAAATAQQIANQRGISFKAAWIEAGFDEVFERPSASAPSKAPAEPTPDPRLLAHTERASKVQPTLPSGYGDDAGAEMTPAQVQAWLASHPDPSRWTDADRQIFEKIEKGYAL